MDWKNKKVLILGLGKSGLAALTLLISAGAKLTVNDQKPERDFPDLIPRLKNYSVEYFFGGHPEEIIWGKDLIVVSPGIPMNLPLLKEARQREIPVWGELELASRFCSAPIVAITGTKGKTTTTALTGEILREDGRSVRVLGNIGIPFAQVATEVTSGDWVVAEVSSFQLESTVKFKPHIAVILNVAADHLDRYSSWEEYIKSKQRIYSQQGPEDYLVLNADNPGRNFSAGSRSRVTFFSRQQQLEDGIFLQDNKVIARWAGNTINVFSPEIISLPGLHNLENCMAAAMVSLIIGVKPEHIRSAIGRFRGIEHRLETVAEINGIKFINDSQATNMLAVSMALQSWDKPLILIAGGRDKGSDFTLLRSLVRERVKLLILLGESVSKIKTALGDLVPVKKVNSLEEAVKIGYQAGSPGDLVLLSPGCASFDMFRNYQERGEIFKRSVRQLQDELSRGDKHLSAGY